MCAEAVGAVLAGIQADTYQPICSVLPCSHGRNQRPWPASVLLPTSRLQSAAMGQQMQQCTACTLEDRSERVCTTANAHNGYDYTPLQVTGWQIVCATWLPVLPCSDGLLAV
jgi:hypothetical protein